MATAAIPRRRLTLGVIALQMLALAGLLVFDLANGGDQSVGLAVGILVFGGLITVTLRGWKDAPIAAVIALALLVGAAMPEPFVTHTAPLVTAIVPMLALLVAPAPWIAISTAVMIGTLVLRAGGVGVYANPETIVYYAMVVVGLTASRVLADRDREELALTQATLRASNAALEERVERRTADLAAAKGELEEVSYAVSHDLRAPLRAMHGYARLIEESPGLTHEALGHLDAIRKNASLMAEQIDDLVRMTEVLRRPLEPRRVDLTAIARHAADALRPAFAGRPVAITVHDLGTATADPDLVELIFTNLIANAIAFSADRDAVVEVGVEDAGGERAYFVRDNGIGFDMRYADKLFRAFERLHPATHGGRGVGLAIVRRAVVRHHGRVWADAAVGKGATFHFTLLADAIG